MPVYKTRTRLIYFRVSEEEFQEYTRLCQAQGARSLSDMARSAVNRMLDIHRLGEEEPLAERLDALDGLARSLNQRLDLLSDLLRKQQTNRAARRGAGGPGSNQDAGLSRKAS